MPPTPVVCPDVSDDSRRVSEPRERLEAVGIWHVFGPAGFSDEVVGLRVPSGDDVATRRIRLDVGERGFRCRVVSSTRRAKVDIRRLDVDDIVDHAHV